MAVNVHASKEMLIHYVAQNFKNMLVTLDYQKALLSTYQGWPVALENFDKREFYKCSVVEKEVFKC